MDGLIAAYIGSLAATGETPLTTMMLIKADKQQ